MIPTAVPSGILFFAKTAQKMGTFCPFFILGVQKCSRTMFTSGEMFVKILQATRIIVTQLTHEGFLGIFGDFWVQLVIVTTLIRVHRRQFGYDVKL
jgi:hypothetical protein